METRALTPLEVRILGFADANPDFALNTGKIRREFGWREAAYVARLYRLIDDPAALAVEPQLVKRLQRIREAKVAQRESRSFVRGVIGYTIGYT